MRRPAGLWANRDFLNLWAGQSISALGTEVTALALPLVAILTLHASALEVAVLNAFDFLPFVLFGLPAGVWVDRLRKRPLLIASDVGRALALASVPVAYAFDALTIWQLYAVGFSVGTLAVTFDISYLSYVPSLVGRDRIIEANAKLEGSRSVAHVAGPGLSGLLVGAFGAPIAIIADAASYLVSALAIGGIKRTERRAERSERRAMRHELAEGVRYVFREPRLRALVTTTGVWNLFASMGFALFLVYFVRRLGFAPEALGGIFTLGSLGTLAGALAARRLGTMLGVGPTIVIAALALGPSALVIPLAPVDAAAPWVVGAIVVGSFAGTVFNINQLSLRQAITPERLQGRMNAVVRVSYWAGVPLGSALGGVLASVIGLRETLFVGAVGATVAMLPLLFSSVRTLRTIPEAPEEPLVTAAVTVP